MPVALSMQSRPGICPGRCLEAMGQPSAWKNRAGTPALAQTSCSCPMTLMKRGQVPSASPLWALSCSLVTPLPPGSVPVSAGAAGPAANPLKSHRANLTCSLRTTPAAAQPSALPAEPRPCHSFSFFLPFPFKCHFLVLSPCTCRAGDPPAHPGWGTQDPSCSAPGHPGRRHQLLISLKKRDQALAAAPMEIQMFIPGPCQKPGVPGLILTTPPACLPCRPPGFDTAALLGFHVQRGRKWLSPGEGP